MATKYTAKEGCVYDFARPLYIGEDARGNLIKQRLYLSTIYIEDGDSIDNYIEIPIDSIEEGELKYARNENT